MGKLLRILERYRNDFVGMGNCSFFLILLNAAEYRNFVSISFDFFFLLRRFDLISLFYRLIFRLYLNSIVRDCNRNVPAKCISEQVVLHGNNFVSH